MMWGRREKKKETEMTIIIFVNTIIGING